MAKYPIVRQLDSMDCGAACLAMVCAYHGMEYSLTSLRDITFVDLEGVSLLNIKTAAEKIGLETLPVKADYAKLQRELPLPAIAHWDQNHFVVVYDVQDDEVVIGDPAMGERKMNRTDFLQNWGDVEANEGVLLLLENPEIELEQEEDPDPESIAEQMAVATATKDTSPIVSDQNAILLASRGSVFGVLKGNRKFWWHLILGSVLLFVIYTFLPLVIKEMVDSGAILKDKNLLNTGILAFAVLGLGRILLELSRNWIFQQEAAVINAKLVSNFLEKLTQQPIRYFEKRLKWDILQRVYDNYKVGAFFQSSSLQAVFYIIMLLSSLLVIMLIDSRLFVIFFAGLLLQVVALFVLQERKLIAKQEMMQSAAHAQDVLFEIINGIASIKLNNAEVHNQEVWERNQVNLLERRLRFTKIEQSQKAVIKAISWITELIIIYFALSMLMENAFSVGSLLAVVYILAYSKNAIVDLFDVLTDYKEVKLSLLRLSELSDLKQREYAIEGIAHLSAYKDISVNGLTFRYGDVNSPIILNDVALRLPRGKKTAIVGVSGAGKTTLIKLLMGMYIPNEGQVKLGDVNVQDITPQILHAKMMAVFEDGHIFTDTIEANITMASGYINHAQLAEAIRIACLDTFMDGLPLGKDTRLGDGGIVLSRGQQQQVLLARAFYKNPKILFFDEATNALDGITERRILKNIDEAFEDKTTVFVAHRLSTIKNADLIVVLHKGVIVEQGTHEELLAKKGAYYLILRNDLE